jgi:predicted nucleic acid-binding protein
MKVVIDTNIVIDTLGVRQPFFAQSKAVTQLAAQGKIEGAITASTITDIAYLLQKYIAPKVDPSRPGVFAHQKNMVVALDSFTSRYLEARMLVTKRSPSELISEMVRKELAAQ